MKDIKQKRAFIEYEANAWFDRNKSLLTDYSSDSDVVVRLLSEYQASGSILEIGCSAGYRLNAIRNKIANSAVFGIEPSIDAVKYGRINFPEVNFSNGTADDLSYYEDDSMDVVIVGFVFYVIDRNILFKTISEIDRVLKNGGMLIIVDFFSETTIKNVYQHINEFKAFSFKQNYDDIFTSSRLYYLLDKSTWSHSTKQLDASDNYHDKYTITLLKKDLSASYR